MNFDQTQREKWEGGVVEDRTRGKCLSCGIRRGGGESGNLNSELQVFEFYLGDKTHTPPYYTIYTYTYSLYNLDIYSFHFLYIENPRYLHSYCKY